MPNTFAYVALFSWPIVVFILFRKLPIATALSVSVIGGYLFLPGEAVISLPMLPDIDKNFVPSIASMIMCFFVSRNLKKQATTQPVAKESRHYENQSSGGTDPKKARARSRVLQILIASVFVFPWITALQNADPIVIGPRTLPGLRIYDAIALTGTSLLMLVPFFLASRYLSGAAEHRKFLVSLVSLACLYAFFALFEVRMSPQLNVWTYGYFPSSFLQHIRGDGFRPVVFLYHGLWLAIFFAMALLAAISLWRAREQQSKRTGFLLIVLWLGITLLFCKSLGALLVSATLATAVLLTTKNMQRAVAAAVALVVLLYPMLRSADIIPIEAIMDFATDISPERAESFAVRVQNERLLLEHANEKPLSGWGGWGRNEIYNPETGAGESVMDGIWVTIRGQYGWIGYLTIFGLLTVPTMLLWLRRKQYEMHDETVALCVVLACGLIDLLPNATLTPITWLAAGAVAGYYKNMLALREPVKEAESRSGRTQNKNQLTY